MLELRGITKKFGDFTAVDDLSLKIESGEFFGLLGPNGAGKTTTIDIISTILLPTSGAVFLDEKELNRKTGAAKHAISVVTQEYSMRQDMNVEEVMEYQGRLYMLPKAKIAEQTDRLLEFAGLTEHRKKRVRQLSGGLKRRLMISRALLTEPRLLLLDEPTTGMDAISRRQTWNLLRELNREGLTVILTTHYLEEAENLCERVALINRGRIAKTGAPSELIKELGEYSVDITRDKQTKTRYFKDRNEAIAFLKEAGSDDVPASFRNTNLEDVFVETVGDKWES